MLYWTRFPISFDPTGNLMERMVRGIRGKGKGFYNNFNPSSYRLRTPVDFVEKRAAFSTCSGEMALPPRGD